MISYISLLLPPLPFALRRPLPLLIAPPRLFPHAFLLEVLCRRRRRGSGRVSVAMLGRAQRVQRGGEMCDMK